MKSNKILDLNFKLKISGSANNADRHHRFSHTGNRLSHMKNNVWVVVAEFVPLIVAVPRLGAIH